MTCFVRTDWRMVCYTGVVGRILKSGRVSVNPRCLTWYGGLNTVQSRTVPKKVQILSP